MANSTFLKIMPRFFAKTAAVTEKNKNGVDES